MAAKKAVAAKKAPVAKTEAKKEVVITTKVELKHLSPRIEHVAIYATDKAKVFVYRDVIGYGVGTKLEGKKVIDVKFGAITLDAKGNIEFASFIDGFSGIRHARDIEMDTLDERLASAAEMLRKTFEEIMQTYGLIPKVSSEQVGREVEPTHAAAETSTATLSPTELNLGGPVTPAKAPVATAADTTVLPPMPAPVQF